MNPKRITLRSKGKGFAIEYERTRWAEKLCFLASLSNEKPFMPNPGRHDHWSIDIQGNDYWLKFHDHDSALYTISCRYDYQVDSLKAMAAYLAARFEHEVTDEAL